jgi:hypothetical protein
MPVKAWSRVSRRDLGCGLVAPGDRGARRVLRAARGDVREGRWPTSLRWTPVESRGNERKAERRQAVGEDNEGNGVRVPFLPPEAVEWVPAGDVDSSLGVHAVGSCIWLTRTGG